MCLYRLRCTLAGMKCLGRCKIDARPAASMCTDRQIKILEIHKEPLIEAPKLLKQRTPNHEKRSHHLINYFGRIVPPFTKDMWREVRRKKPIETETLTDH